MWEYQILSFIMPLLFSIAPFAAECKAITITCLAANDDAIGLVEKPCSHWSDTRGRTKVGSNFQESNIRSRKELLSRYRMPIWIRQSHAFKYHRHMARDISSVNSIWNREIVVKPSPLLMIITGRSSPRLLFSY